MKRLWLILVGLSLILLLGWGCGEQKEQKIRLYTSMPSAIIQAVQAEFSKQYPEIELEVIAEGTTALRSRIDLESESPQGLQADLIWAADPSEYIGLINKGLLLQYDSSESSLIPPQFKDNNNYYYGARLISVCIAYNTDQVASDKAPRFWSDLQDSTWKDKIVSADPRRSGAALAWFAAMVKQKNWDYIEALGKNNLSIEKKNGIVAAKLEQGEYQAAIVLDYIVRKKKLAGSPIEIVYPEDGVVVIPSPIAITETSENINDAKTFVDYVLSSVGQELLVREGSFIAVRSDVQPPVGMERSAVKNVLDRAVDIDWSEVNTNKIKTKREFKRIILD